MSSVAKIEANRRNSLQSTGPKSTAGKASVRWNALKHGLLSGEIEVSEGMCGEDPAEFKKLLQALVIEMEPIGVLESILVERIAMCYWRLRRAIRAENGEITRHLEMSRWEETFRTLDEFENHKEFPSLTSSRAGLSRSSLGNRFLGELLEKAEAEVRETGWVDDQSQKELLRYFGPDDHGIAFWLVILTSMAKEASGQTEGTGTDGEVLPAPDRCQSTMLKLIDKERRKLKTLGTTFAKLEDTVATGVCLSSSIPSKDQVDRILRYETAIERQLYRAMDQLERLQRRRQGESVPPPINIDFSPTP